MEEPVAICRNGILIFDLSFPRGLGMHPTLPYRIICTISLLDRFLEDFCLTRLVIIYVMVSDFFLA